MANVPITFGTGQASIAGDTVGSTTYQTIKVVDGTVGSTTPLKVNTDGSINASIFGTPSFNLVGIPSISGQVGASILGTVPVVQSGTVITSVSGTVIASVSGSVGIVGNPSISGSVNISNSPTVNQGTTPWIIVGSVYGNISGSVVAIQGGTQITSVSGNVTINPASISGTVGASIIGQLPGGNAVIGAVAASISGTVPTVVTGSVLSYSAPLASLVSGVTSLITSTGLTSVLSAATGSIKNYVSHILITNGAAVGTFVDVKDGGGNVLYSGYAAASGGGFSATFISPLVGSANKSVDVQPRTQASIIAAMTGFTA